MECNHVEDLISNYIENELPRELQKEITLHLESCPGCRMLREKIEDLMYSFPALEEEVPFFVKNRLYYIPESQTNIIEMPKELHYLKWVAAMVGAFALFLNLFYFTNIVPPANKALHLVFSGIKTFGVKTEAIYEKVKESNKLFFLSAKNDEIESDDKINDDKKYENSAEKNIEKNDENNGGKNG
jgi:hypothetical protein